MTTPLVIRPIFALGDMYAAVDLQKTYWGNDLESVIPAHMLFSLATWNAGDPSWSYAADAPVKNAMGYPGAVLSDIALQFFGIAALPALLSAWSGTSQSFMSYASANQLDVSTLQTALNAN